MDDSHQHLLKQLITALGTLQEDFEHGISEFELINILKNPPHSLFCDNALRDSLMLFQTHFVLFHALHTLKNTWHNDGIGDLEIIATRIQLKPIQDTSSLAALVDPLAQYYLDWENLAKTQQTDVDTMLAQFWVKMGQYTQGKNVLSSISDEDVQRAKVVLGIAPTAELNVAVLKQHYKKLQLKHHPDKGGTGEESQNIINAYTCLQAYLKS
ncbi:MAG: DNA-J related domain-containing protein [Glaciecola sp.]